MGILTREEIRQLLVLLKSYYPNSFTNHTAEGSQLVYEIWCKTFENEDKNLVQNAVLKCIQESTSSFAPNIGQIRQKMVALAQIPMMDADSAWETARRFWSTISSEDVRDIHEQWEKLPEQIRRIYSDSDMVELGFHTSSHDIETFEKPRFMKAWSNYESQYQRSLIESKSITAIATEQKLMIGEGNGKN